MPPKALTELALFDEAGLRSHAYDDELRLMVECRERELSRAEAMFKAHIEKAGVQGAWCVLSGNSLAALVPDAIFGDLTILGNEPLGAATSADPFFAGTVAIESGRPVLRIPAGAKAERFGTRVLIAWNERREAARAIADATPLLKRASFVTLMQVLEPWQDVEQGLDAPEKIILHLRHLGVVAESYVVQAPDHEIAQQLLSHADRTDCDLIVMGAYGHSPIGETVRGGVTRSILKDSEIPLFLSH